MTRSILLSVGLWPLQKDYPRFLRSFLVAICVALNLFMMIPLGIFIYTDAPNISLGRSIYLADWHKLSGSNARSVILLLVRANRPFALTAGKLIVLSMASFAKVIKTSAAYFNVLWNITSHSVNAQ
ncbi:hypothetical protein TKK_0006836 [Trichogramma kaykai]